MEKFDNLFDLKKYLQKTRIPNLKDDGQKSLAREFEECVKHLEILESALYSIKTEATNTLYP